MPVCILLTQPIECRQWREKIGLSILVQDINYRSCASYHSQSMRVLFLVEVSDGS